MTKLTMIGLMMWLWAEYAAVAVAATPSEKLLPSTTSAYVSIADLRQFDARFRASHAGRLFHDVPMRPFADDARQKFDTACLSRLGCTYEELKAIAAGEFCWAMLDAGGKQDAYVGLLDVTGNVAKAQEQIARAGVRLEERGAKRRVQQLVSTQVTDYERKLRDGTVQSAAFALKENILLVATRLSVLERLLREWDRPQPAPLADAPAYRAVQSSCASQVGGQDPDLRWFVDPLGALSLLSKPDPLEPEAKDAVVRFKKHGFDGVKGVGGFLGFSRDGYDLVASLAVHAPPPRHKSLAMFNFPVGQDFTPHAWLTDDLNMHATLYWDLLRAFDHFGPVFDDAAADGIEGTFDDILKDLKSAEGPGVDLRKDLVSLFGPRVTLVNDAIRPVSPTSERSLIGIEVRDEAAAALAVKKLLRDDPGVRRLGVPGQDHDLWVIGGDSDIGEKDEKKRSFRTLAVMVARGHLLIATSGDLIQKLLRAPGPAKLASAADLALVEGELKKLAGTDVGLHFFSRAKTDLYTSYEHLRLGTADKNESLYGMMLPKLLSAVRDGETGKSSLDFSKLPKFAAIEKHLGWVAGVGKNEEQGWVLIGVLLPPAVSEK